MSVRDWKEEDLPSIAEIEKLSFSDPWSEQSLKETFASSVFKGFVAEEDGRVIGYSGVLFCYDAEIALIAVHPSFRRRGIAGKLLDRSLAFSEEKGAENVFLEVRTSNAPARALYESRGFIPISIRKAYYADGEDAIVMVRLQKFD